MVKLVIGREDYLPSNDKPTQTSLAVYVRKMNGDLDARHGNEI